MGDNNLLLILLIVLVPVGIFFWWKKRKKNQSTGGVVQKRHEGNEVRDTIKKFLKSNGEIGKELVESYVVKRADPYVVNRALPKEEQEKQKKLIKERKEQEKQKKIECKKEGKTYKKEKPRELYVVLFVTRNSKTGVEDKPRAIECEVKNIKKGNSRKSPVEKKIITLGERNYEEESKWILPIKLAEENKIKKEYARQQKYKKLNFIKTIKDKKIKSIESDPEKLALYNEKQAQKEEKKLIKKQEKEKREKEKWEKKETVVKTKK
ncbi:MAG: DUF5385 domain-containing protein [Malacoplasma sp.]|nr:DUF5385 domain-containing protein [Malacoplasma sp.]MDE6894340.1 DUF5385 domain-containing protein [Malacoplasma sp.]